MFHQITPCHRLGLSLLLVGLFASSIYAQEVRPPTASSVVATAIAEHVRFAAPNTAVQLRLQVYDRSGDLLFDASTKGNVLDWTVQGSGGERLSAGSYLCVVTVKNLSGRISQRIGAVSVQEQRVELQGAEQRQLTGAQQREIGSVEENAAISILKENDGAATTVIAHNGEEGQIVRGRGALSFRLGAAAIRLS